MRSAGGGAAGRGGRTLDSLSAFGQAATVVLGLALCIGACASELRRIDALDARDREQYQRCRTHVEARLCVETSRCSERALQLYQAEPQRARPQWLRGHGCPRELIEGTATAQPMGAAAGWPNKSPTAK